MCIANPSQILAHPSPSESVRRLDVSSKTRARTRGLGQSTDRIPAREISTNKITYLLNCHQLSLFAFQAYSYYSNEKPYKVNAKKGQRYKLLIILQNNIAFTVFFALEVSFQVRLTLNLGMLSCFDVC
jgi:hypothetical protein